MMVNPYPVRSWIRARESAAREDGAITEHYLYPVIGVTDDGVILGNARTHQGEPLTHPGSEPWSPSLFRLIILPNTSKEVA